MGLFGDKAKKAEDEAAARAEFDRLAGLPAVDLAAEILPAWGDDGVKRVRGGTVGRVQVTNWLLEPNPRRHQYLKPLTQHVAEAIAALENAGLLLRKTYNDGGATADLTDLGRQALAEGDVRAYLGGDAATHTGT